MPSVKGRLIEAVELADNITRTELLRVQIDLKRYGLRITCEYTDENETIKRFYSINWHDIETRTHNPATHAVRVAARRAIKDSNMRTSDQKFLAKYMQ